MKTVTGTIPSGGFFRTDLLDITLPNGQHLRAVCGGDGDVTRGGNTYYAAANGVWSRGSATSEAMFGLNSQSMDLSVIAPDGVNFPGTAVPLPASFTTGAWDGSPVSLTTAYMPLRQYGTVAASMVLWAGMISSVRPAGRSKATVTCQDWLYLCNIQVPRRVIQPGCFATFGDTACTFALSSIGIANSVGAGSSPVLIVPGSAWPASDARGNSISASYNGSGYFAAGKLQWTSGNNAGFYSHIAGFTGANLTLAQAPPFTVVTGDEFTAYAGCQKLLSDCSGRWGNQIHFLGMPWVPPPEQSI